MGLVFGIYIALFELILINVKKTFKLTKLILIQTLQEEVNS